MAAIEIKSDRELMVLSNALIKKIELDLSMQEWLEKLHPEARCLIKDYEYNVNTAKSLLGQINSL